MGWVSRSIVLPFSPVNLGEHSIDRVGICRVCFDKSCEGVLHAKTGDTLQRVGIDVVLEETLELLLADDSLNVRKQLESLLVRHFSKGIVWVVSGKNWVNR